MWRDLAPAWLRIVPALVENLDRAPRLEGSGYLAIDLLFNHRAWTGTRGEPEGLQQRFLVHLDAGSRAFGNVREHLFLQTFKRAGLVARAVVAELVDRTRQHSQFLGRRSEKCGDGFSG